MCFICDSYAKIVTFCLNQSFCKIFPVIKSDCQQKTLIQPKIRFDIIAQKKKKKIGIAKTDVEI